MSSEQKKVFVIQPFAPEFEGSYILIKQVAAAAAGVTIFRVDEVATAGAIIESIYQAIEECDLIICDISQSNPNVMYELGYAHALKKPVILISRKPEHMPFDVRSVRTLYYDFEQVEEFMNRLRVLILDAIDNPDNYSVRPRTETSINSLFISYSHTDRVFLDRLLVHLRPLETEGLVDVWEDSRIRAGDKWKIEIEEALNHARVAILLVSADFLASEFIIKNELPPILAKAESEGTRIIPVIIKPCRFTRDKNLSQFQAINNPSNPVINLTEGERECVYDAIAQDVEKAMIR